MERGKQEQALGPFKAGALRRTAAATGEGVDGFYPWVSFDMSDSFYPWVWPANVLLIHESTTSVSQSLREGPTKCGLGMGQILELAKKSVQGALRTLCS